MSALLDALDRARSLAESADDTLYRAAPGVSAWSVAQHLDHVAKATRGCLAAAARIAAGKGEPGGAPNRRGRAILLFGRIPRGKGQAPPRALPEERPARETILDQLAKARAAAEGLDPAAVARAKGTMPHHHIGSLNARQWVRFAAIHLEHHLALVRDVLAAPSTR